MGPKWHDTGQGAIVELVLATQTLREIMGRFVTKLKLQKKLESKIKTLPKDGEEGKSNSFQQLRKSYSLTTFEG